VSWVERRAFRSTERLAKMREELQVIDEQLAALRWEADDAHVRAVVTENVADKQEDFQASRHASALERARAGLAGRIARAEARHRRLVERAVRRIGQD
jgi:hypothetical protein